MDNNTAQLLKELATKLGTTSEYLWNVLIKQAPIDAIEEAMWSAFGIIATYVLYKVHTKLIEHDRKEYSLYSQESHGVIMTIALIVVFIWDISIIAGSIPTIINAIFNPEYWAFKQITHLLGR